MFWDVQSKIFSIHSLLRKNLVKFFVMYFCIETIRISYTTLIETLTMAKKIKDNLQKYLNYKKGANSFDQ